MRYEGASGTECRARKPEAIVMQARLKAGLVTEADPSPTPPVEAPVEAAEAATAARKRVWQRRPANGKGAGRTRMRARVTRADLAGEAELIRFVAAPDDLMIWPI